MIDIALAILKGIPAYVYVIFVVLTVGGLRMIRDSHRPLAAALIAPGVFMLWGLWSVFHATHVIGWVWAAALGALLGAVTLPAATRYDRESKTLFQAGSWLPLLRNLTIFFTRMALHILAVMVPAKAASLLSADLWFGGLTCGYFMGWMAMLVYKHRNIGANAQAVLS